MQMRNRRLLVCVAALAIALASLAAWRLLAGPSVEAHVVERGDLLQTVVASGRVESPRRVEIGTSVTGTVVSVPVREGQKVSAGQLLVAIDPSEARAAVDQARSSLAQAEARMTQLRATAFPVAAETARQAEVNLANAERTLARARDLFARGFVGQAALDDAERLRDVGQSQVASARLQRDSQADGGTDYRLAAAGLEAARAGARLAQARLALTTIEAPVAGILISRSVETGALAQPGKPLMVLSPDGDTELVVQIDERNLHLLAVGQSALASADAYPERRFAAKVAYINPAVDPLRGSIEVKLAIADPPAYLLQDMTVSVDIEVARRPAALVLPADGLRAGGWVLAVRGGHAVRQPVKTGARGEGRIEILEGLAEGELVVPGSQTAISPGGRVRAVATQPAPRP